MSVRGLMSFECRATVDFCLIAFGFLLGLSYHGSTDAVWLFLGIFMLFLKFSAIVYRHPKLPLPQVDSFDKLYVLSRGR